MKTLYNPAILLVLYLLRGETRECDDTLNCNSLSSKWALLKPRQRKHAARDEG